MEETKIEYFNYRLCISKMYTPPEMEESLGNSYRLAIHEVYWDKEGNPVNWSVDPIDLTSFITIKGKEYQNNDIDTAKAELKEEINLFLAAFNHPVLDLDKLREEE